MKSKYIDIRELPPNPRTKRWSIVNLRTGEVCGEIRWHGAFRKYCFFPPADFLYDAECLGQITAHLIAHAKDRVNINP